MFEAGDAAQRGGLAATGRPEQHDDLAAVVGVDRGRAVGQGDPVPGGEPGARAELQLERISQLLKLAKLGKGLLDALVSTAKIDAEPLVRFLLGARSEASNRS